MDTRLAALSIESGHVIAAITLVVLPIAAVTFARSGSAWREVGKGPFAIEQELPRPPGPQPLDRRAQAEETRQMLEAKSYRRTRSGAPPLDVEAEMARLLEQPSSSPGADDELRAEVRQLVVVRNERRMRRGEEPLDVEAETERQLADLLGSG